MTNKIRTIIVDDEPLALDLLRSYLSDDQRIEIIAECKNGREAIEQATKLQPELMFLDIQMPGLTGFDVIKGLQADIMPLVVFVTAYEQFAVSAFDIHAVDYILKPLDEMSLERALTRCIDRLGQEIKSDGYKPDFIEAIDDITHNNSAPSAPPQATKSEETSLQKIVVKDRSAITLIDQSDIDWIDAAGDYMCLHVSGVTHIMRSTLKSLLDQLDPDLFKRVHRSTIVNLSRIEKIIPHTKGEYFLELAENEQIKVSRNYRSVIKDFIQASGGK